MINPNGVLGIINRATIEAGPLETMVLITGTSNPLVNTGILQATGTGSLNLLTLGMATVTNGGGLIQADDGAHVQIGTVALTGGTLSVTRAGTMSTYPSVIRNASLQLNMGRMSLSGSLTNSLVQMTSGSLMLNSETLNAVAVTGDSNSILTGYVMDLTNVSFLGGLPVSLSGVPSIAGRLINTGNFQMNGGLSVKAGVTLSGSGDLLINGGFLDASPRPQVFTNLDNLIHGSGVINPSGRLAFVNRSVLQSDPGLMFTVLTGSQGAVINSGTIAAVQSAIAIQAVTSSGTLTNAGGLILSSGSSASLTLGSGGGALTINGGRLRAENGAAFNANAITIKSASMAVDHTTATLTGTVASTPVALTSSTLTIAGGANALTNVVVTGSAASVQLNGVTQLNTVSFRGVPVIANAPTYVLGYLQNNNTITLNAPLFASGVTTLTGSGDLLLHTEILADARPGAPAHSTLVNLNNTIHGIGTLNPNGDLAIINRSLIQAGTGEYLTIYGGTGVTVSGSGGTLVNVDNTIRGTGIIGGGIAFINDGTVLAAPGDAITLESGTGASLSKVRNDNVFSLQNTATQTASIGVNGDFLQTGTATLSFHLGGILTSGSQWQLNFSPMTISGNASLAGAFHLTLDTGVVVNAGTVLTILTYGTETGSFTSFAGLDLPNGVTLVPSYTAHAFVLTAEAPIVFPSSPAPAGQSAPVEPSPSGPAPVPEPSSGALVLLAGMLLARCRRRASV